MSITIRINNKELLKELSEALTQEDKSIKRLVKKGYDVTPQSQSTLRHNRQSRVLSILAREIKKNPEKMNVEIDESITQLVE